MTTKPSPEAMVYLRLLGNELGYLRTNEMEEMAYSAAMMIDKMLSMFPADVCNSIVMFFKHFFFLNLGDYWELRCVL